MTDIKPGVKVTTAWNPKAVYTVIATFDGTAWVHDADPCTRFYAVRDLTLIPPKIAEPGVGEVVWDFYEPAGKRIPFTHLAPAGKAWSAFVNGRWYNLHWSDFSDDVTLAVDPKAASHD